MMKISESNNTVDLQKEAKSIVLDELENQGVIARMRAQIKNSVLKVLGKQKQSVKNNIEFDYMTPLHRMNKTKEVILAYHIIKEFMQFYELDYTLPIFENETNIRENIKRETLLNELFSISNQTNISGAQSEPKPVLIQLISNYQQEMQNKKNNMDNLSQKLDDSYGAKTPHYSGPGDFNIKENQNKTVGKKQLAPINFVNKSVDMKESSSPKDMDSLKFNTANISDIYSQQNSLNNSKSSLNTAENKNAIKENNILNSKAFNNETPSPINNDQMKFQFNSADYTTNNQPNNKYDDEFNEVILEEINEGKNALTKGEEWGEDSKKSLTASGLNFASSMGYDSSVTNYKLEDFDHVEDVEKPI